MRLILLTCLALLVAAPAARAADVNGDSLADLIVLGPGEADNLRHTAVVVLGSRTPASLDTAHPAPGTTYTLRSSLAVINAKPLGDVDGDGLDDLWITTQTSGRDSTSTDYVLFGRHETTDVDIEASAQRLPSTPANTWPIGDLNGDGADDLAFTTKSGASIVYGRKDRQPYDARVPAFKVNAGPYKSPYTKGFDIVGSAGDANGDGLDDLLVAPEATSYCGEGGSGCGAKPFVIFGRRSPRDTELTKTGVRTRTQHRPAGYFVDGISGYRNTDSAGDVDGDGRDDLFVTRWEYGPGTEIAFGTKSTKPVKAKLPGAVRIHRTHIWGYGGGPIGDFNGDGLADNVVTIYDDKINAISVIPGSRERRTIDPRRASWQIATPKAAGLNWYGPVGDVNGDGLADFALQADAFVRQDQPAVTYVVLGRRGPLPARIEDGGFTISG